MLKLAKNKQKLSSTLRLNFRYFHVICFLHPLCHLKMIEDILKTVQETSESVLMTFMINGNENETGNEN